MATTLLILARGPGLLARINLRTRKRTRSPCAYQQGWRHRLTAATNLLNFCHQGVLVSTSFVALSEPMTSAYDIAGYVETQILAWFSVSGLCCEQFKPEFEIDRNSFVLVRIGA